MIVLRLSVEAVRSALTDLARRPLASILSILAMAVAQLVLAFFLLLAHGAQDAFERWSDQAAIEFYLQEGAPEAQLDEVVKLMEGRSDVRRIERVDAQRALEEFKVQFPELADIDDLLEQNPLPASVRIVPIAPDPELTESLVALAKTLPAVVSVRYDRQWLEALEQLGEAIGWLILSGAVVLLSAALVSVGGVMRLALNDKRDEVVLMRLVGAPFLFVLAPVLLGGALLGGLGGGLALFLSKVIREVMLARAEASSFSGLADVLLGRGLTPIEALLLIVLGILAGTTVAALAAGRAALR